MMARCNLLVHNDKVSLESNIQTKITNLSKNNNKMVDRTILYSMIDEECGQDCGTVLNVFLKVAYLSMLIFL